MKSREYSKIKIEQRNEFFKEVRTKYSEIDNLFKELRTMLIDSLKYKIACFPPHDLNMPNFENNEDDMIALHYAAQSDYEAVFDAVLSIEEVNVNAVNKNNESPLILATKVSLTTYAIKLLSKPGIDVETVDINGESALHIASKFGNHELVKELIKNGANINLKTPDGNTPLILAAMNSHPNTVKILLENKADITHQNNAGNTASHYAKLSNHPDLRILATQLPEPKPTEIKNENSYEKRLEKYHGEINHDFCCPGTTLLMVNPVTLSTSGHSYEQSFLTECLAHFPIEQKTIPCPVTRILIPRSEIENAKVNLVLQELIAKYVSNLEKMMRINNTKFRLFEKSEKAGNHSSEKGKSVSSLRTQSL